MAQALEWLAAKGPVLWGPLLGLAVKGTKMEGIESMHTESRPARTLSSTVSPVRSWSSS